MFNPALLDPGLASQMRGERATTLRIGPIYVRDDSLPTPI